jgi:hypothetical protein
MIDESGQQGGDAHQEGGAARRPEPHEKGKAQEQSGNTEAGQEARRGVPPGEHDTEHQSQYGGGGRNGGAKQ